MEPLTRGSPPEGRRQPVAAGPRYKHGGFPQSVPRPLCRSKCDPGTSGLGTGWKQSEMQTPRPHLRPPDKESALSQDSQNELLSSGAVSAHWDN